MHCLSGNPYNFINFVFYHVLLWTEKTPHSISFGNVFRCLFFPSSFNYLFEVIHMPKTIHQVHVILYFLFLYNF